MKIEDIDVIPVALPIIRRTMAITRHVSDVDTFVIIKIKTDEGITGIGEATTPMTTGWGESQGTSVSVLTNLIKPALVGEDPFNIERIWAKMGDIGRGSAFPLYPNSKGAVDIALYDIIGKTLGVPLYKLLGGNYRNRIQIMPSLRILKPRRLKQEAERYLQSGFCFGIKYKAGLDTKRDILAAKALREVIGEDLPIVCDPNGVFTPSAAIRLIRQIERYAPVVIEQPVPGWDLDGMAEVKRKVESPIMADESVWTPRDVLSIFRKNAADMLLLYHTKSGGVHPARKAVCIAENVNLPCAIGEICTGVGTAVDLHLATALRNISEPCQILGPALLKDDIIKNPFRYVKGCLQAPDKPGLGIELDEEKLRRYEQLVRAR